MSDICDQINNGEPINEIICDVTPGGGKTGLGIIATKKLTRVFSDKSAVFVPRNTLKFQFEEDMLDPFFDSNRTIRVADNTPNPCRGLDGFATTYQGLGANPRNIIEDFKKHKYISFHDEFHHIGSGQEWEIPLREIRSLSKLKIYATGTAFRQTGNISFLPYGENGLLDRTETKHRKFITYTRSDALKEGAIVPIEFETIDGSGSYLKNNKIRHYRSIEHKDLRAALMSDYAFQLIDHGLDKFLSFRKYNPEAKMVIVAKDIQTAKMYADYVCRRVSCETVTSDDKDALKTIERFRKGEFPVMSSVAMCYEGLSIKEISDIVALTGYRSISWLSQMVARGVRVKPWKEYCRVTAPADPEFLSFMSALINEQEQICGEQKAKPNPKKKGNGNPKLEIEILSGEAHIPPSAKEKMVREELNLLINRYIGVEASKTGSIVHTESMRRRKILWMKIYITIGRKCKLKEMDMDEMKKSLELIKALTVKGR